MSSEVECNVRPAVAYFPLLPPMVLAGDGLQGVEGGLVVRDEVAETEAWKKIMGRKKWLIQYLSGHSIFSPPENESDTLTNEGLPTKSGWERG